MFDKMVCCITRTGKAHRWLKPLALIALVLLFCGASLTKWAVSRFARIRKTGGQLRELRRDAMEQRERGKERAGAAKPVRSFYRPAHRAAAVALSVCMVFTLMPSMAFAAEAEIGLCEHHPEHTAECGYEPASPCEHEHDGDCYTDERICGFDEETEQTASGSDAGHTHTQDCYRLDCPHERGEHDESCGYSKGAPCTYTCELCNSSEAPSCLCDPQVAGEDGVHTNPDCPLYENQAPVCLCDPQVTEPDGVHTSPDCPFYAEPDEIDALCAAIDALPTVDELYANAPGNQDSEFDAWAAETRALLAEVPALQTRLLALAEDSAVMERITEERADKLADLLDLAEKLKEARPLDTTVVSIGDNSYNTLAEAITAASSGDTLKIIGTIDLSANSVIISGKNLTLDLNGKTVTYSGRAEALTLTKGAGLTVKDSGTGGKLESTFTGHTIASYTASTVTVSGGTVSATTGSAIRNNNTGKITVSGSAEVTSDNPQSSRGTIYLYEVPSPAQTVLDIQGGTVKNTADNGYAVYFVPATVTTDNLTDYYTAAPGATVGRVHPEPAAPTPTPTVSGTMIFANGAELKIVAGTTEGYTNILYDKNNDNTIGDTEYLKIGNTDPTATGYDFSAYRIYGGGSDTNVDGVTKITMTGGKISYLYGGGRANFADADVKGTEIILSGGVVNGSVYGGGEAYASDKTASVTGDTSVTISGDAAVNMYVSGGGNAGNSRTTATVTGNAAITMTGGKAGLSDTNGKGIYGGGSANVGAVPLWEAPA